MKEFWEEHYSVDEYIFGTAPNLFLVSQQHLLQAGQQALALADGEGRNGVWLARQGLQVTSIDFSENAVAKAKKLAAEAGVTLHFEVGDVFTWEMGENRFDVIVAIFIQFATPEQRGQLFGHIKRALKPGGYLILQGYTPKQLEYKTGGPSAVGNLYTASMLQDYFSDMEILHLREHEDFIAEGTKHYGMSALVDLAARKL
jgi:cyclopropane fatty-acyl-phospholipid synthase-like methyltransferase